MIPPAKGVESAVKLPGPHGFGACPGREHILDKEEPRKRLKPAKASRGRLDIFIHLPP